MRKIDWKNLAGLAAGALMVCGAAQAQPMDGTMTTPATTMDSNMGAMAPMSVTGTVVRYYADRSGYVTAMDLQTADGVKMVRFAPGMGQRLSTTYPVGSQATVYTTSTTMGAMTRMDVVGVGETMPSTMMPSYMASDVDVLQASPYITIGSKIQTVSGTLKGLVTDDMGNVLALIVGGKEKSSLVRVPTEFRATGTMYSTADRATPLFKGAKIDAVGYEEAPRYGALSAYDKRLVATAITVNSHSVGSGSLVPMMAKKYDTILGFNLFGSGKGKTMSGEESSAGKMGYMTYDPNMMSDMPMNTAPAAADSTMTTPTTGGGTMGGM